MPTPGFKRSDTGGPAVYDIAGDGSSGYCEAVAIANASDISGGGGGGGGAVTVADGADVALGAVADAAVAAGAAGTLAAKLRRLSADLAILLAQTDGLEASAASLDAKTPALGQALAAASTPVVLTAAQLTSLTAPVLAAGSAKVGVVTTDQTTHGTTDLVAADLTKVGGTAVVTGGVAGSQGVGGLAATGAAVAGNPQLMGLKDTGGNAQPVTGDTSGNLFVTGSVASGVTDAGNPVKVGGVAATAPGSATAGQRKDLWVDLKGAAVVRLVDANGTLTGAGAVSTGSTSIDNVNLNSIALANGGAIPQLCNSGTANGTTFDRQRNNHELTVLASAARTGATNSSDIVNYNGTKLKVVIDITAVAGSPSLTFTIKGKSTLSGKYFTILASAALATISTTVLTVALGATVTANVSINDFVPRLWRVEVVAGTADSVTYSVDAQVIV